MKNIQTPTWTNDTMGMYAIYFDVQVKSEGKAMYNALNQVMTFPSIKVTRDSIEVELFDENILADQPGPEDAPIPEDIF
jgi:FAD synthase